MSLPKTFRQLAYIQSTGTQYIDTGVVPSFSNFEIKFTDFYVVSYLNT